MNEQIQLGIWIMASGAVIILILWLKQRGLLGNRPEQPKKE